MQNTNMPLKHLVGNLVTYGNNPGDEPVLCEGIPFTLQFANAKELHCYPLDESGNRQAAVAAENNSVRLGPEYTTLWYEIEVK